MFVPLIGTMSDHIGNFFTKSFISNALHGICSHQTLRRRSPLRDTTVRFSSSASERGAQARDDAETGMSVKRPDPVDVEVGHRIRIQRLARGLSQTALANHLGVTFQQVQKYEKGVNRVGAGRLTRIAEVLGVPVGSFFTGQEKLSQEDGDAGAESPLKLLTVSGAFRLLRSYAEIEDGNLRRSIVELVEKVASQRR
jgi:transcriptional regulator with XRE-family HTH domain